MGAKVISHSALAPILETLNLISVGGRALAMRLCTKCKLCALRVRVGATSKNATWELFDKGFKHTTNNINS